MSQVQKNKEYTFDFRFLLQWGDFNVLITVSVLMEI